MSHAGRTVRRPTFCHCPYHNRKLARTSPWYYHYGFFSSLARKDPRFRANTVARPHQPRPSPSTTGPIFPSTFVTSTTDSIPEAGYCRSPAPRGFLPGIKNRTLRLSRNYLNLSTPHSSTFPRGRYCFRRIESYLQSVHPDNFIIAVDVLSQVPYAFTLLFRRRGWMTDVQKKN